MTGSVISFIGMDGAGKTTLTNRLISELRREGHKTKYIYSGKGRDNILPIQFFGRKYSKKKRKEEVGGNKSRKKISVLHTIAAPVFAFDLLLRYLFVIFPRKIGNEFVITDRYSTDILLMDKVSFGFKRFLYLFLPKPDKIFYIYHNLDVLNRRKPSHPYQDLKRQKAIFSRILRKIDYVPVKNESIRGSVEKIKKELLNDR